jgi:hypothetical protein
MNKNSEYETEVTPYECQLARSFNFVISEAEQLYQGQGRLRKTYDRLTKRMTAKGRLQDLADVQRLIQEHGLNAEFAEELNAYVRDKFLDLLS